MRLTCRVLTSFERKDYTPDAVRWEGVLQWEDADRVNPNGYPSRFLKLQCGMREGPNGLFLTMPYVRRIDPATGRQVAAKDQMGRYRNYVDLGVELMQMGVAAVQRHLGGEAPSPMAHSGYEQYDLREQAKQAFNEEGRQPGPPALVDRMTRLDSNEPVKVPGVDYSGKTANDPLGDLDEGLPF